MMSILNAGNISITQNISRWLHIHIWHSSARFHAFNQKSHSPCTYPPYYLSVTGKIFCLFRIRNFFVQWRPWKILWKHFFLAGKKKKPWRRGVTFRKRSLSLSFVCYYFSLKTTRQNCETHWTTVFYNSDTSITTDPRHVNFEVNSIQRMAFTSAKSRIRIVCKLFGGKLIGLNNSMALRVLHQD